MKNLHEYVYYQDGLPIRVFVHNQHYVPLHWHREIELILVLSGCVQVAIGQIRIDAAEGDVVIVNGNEMHSTTTPSKDPVIILGLQIDPGFCGGLLPDISRIWFRNCYFMETPPAPAALDWTRYCLARLLWESIERKEGYQFALQGIVYSIVSHLTRSCRQTMEGFGSLDVARDEFRGLSPVLDYIDSHFMEKLSLHEIAESKGMSHFHLSHLFKAKVGVSFSKYVNGIRIAKALDLLAYSEQKIVDIIYACGFSGPEFFYKLFRQKQHCTPSEFRRKYRPRSRLARKQASSANVVEVSHGMKVQAEPIVERLLLHLRKFRQDRAYSDSDKRALLAAVRRNDPRQTRYFAGVHSIEDQPRQGSTDSDGAAFAGHPLQPAAEVSRPPVTEVSPS